jgi:hypothetical protein
MCVTVKLLNGNEPSKLEAVQHDRDRINFETAEVQSERNRIKQEEIYDNKFQSLTLLAFGIAAAFAVAIYWVVSDTFCTIFNSMLSRVGLAYFHAGPSVSIYVSALPACNSKQFQR